MSTAYNTVISWNDVALAAGFGGAEGEDRPAAVERPRGKNRALGGDNVIDLTAWRAANLEEFRRAPDQQDWDKEEREEPELRVSRAPRRTRGRRRRAVFLGELVSTLSVVAASAALILRVLLF